MLLCLHQIKGGRRRRLFLEGSSKRLLRDITGYTSLSKVPDDIGVFELIRVNNESRCLTNRYKVPRLAYLRTYTRLDIFIVTYLKYLQNKQSETDKYTKEFEKSRVLGIDTDSFLNFSKSWYSGYCFLDVYYFDEYPDYIPYACRGTGRGLILLGDEFKRYYCELLISILKIQFSEVVKYNMVLFHDVYIQLYGSCLKELYSNLGYEHSDLKQIGSLVLEDCVRFIDYRFYVSLNDFKGYVDFIKTYCSLYQTDNIEVYNMRLLEVLS